MKKIHFYSEKGISYEGVVVSGYKEKGEVYLNILSDFENGKFKKEENGVYFYGYHDNGFKEKLYSAKEGEKFTWGKKEYKRMTMDEIEKTIPSSKLLLFSPVDDYIDKLIR